MQRKDRNDAQCARVCLLGRNKIWGKSGTAQRIDQTFEHKARVCASRRVSHEPLPNCDDHGGCPKVETTPWPSYFPMADGAIERHPYGQKIKDRQLSPVSEHNVLNPHNLDDSLLRVRACAVPPMPKRKMMCSEVHAT